MFSFTRVAYNACTTGGCATSPLSAPLLTGDSEHIMNIRGVMLYYLIVDMTPEDDDNIGLILGIVGGAVAAIALVILIIILICCYRRRSKRQQYDM